jgi:hypothetical protein
VLETCSRCGTRFASGLPACPHCWLPAGGTAGEGEESGEGEGEGELPKITVSGGPSHAQEPPVPAAADGAPGAAGEAPAAEPAVTEPEPVAEVPALPAPGPEPVPAPAPKKAAPSLSRAKADG